jgi:hypothetical protein
MQQERVVTVDVPASCSDRTAREFPEASRVDGADDGFSFT